MEFDIPSPFWGDVPGFLQGGSACAPSSWFHLRRENCPLTESSEGDPAKFCLSSLVCSPFPPNETRIVLFPANKETFRCYWTLSFLADICHLVIFMYERIKSFLLGFWNCYRICWGHMLRSVSCLLIALVHFEFGNSVCDICIVNLRRFWCFSSFVLSCFYYLLAFLEIENTLYFFKM